MRISDAEMEIMQVIWQLDREVTTKELTELLPHKKLTTISTLAGRLIDKGVLGSEKIGRSHAHKYRALITENEYKAMQTKSFLKSIHRGSVKSLISALFKDDGLTQDDIKELREFINRGGDDTDA